MIALFYQCKVISADASSELNGIRCRCIITCVVVDGVHSTATRKQICIAARIARKGVIARSAVKHIVA